MSAVQRGRTPEFVDVANRLGDLDLSLGADLLQDQLHRKQRLQVGRADGLQRAGVQHERQRLGQVGLDVVLKLGHLAFVEQVLGGCGHAHSPVVGVLGFWGRVN